MCSQDGPGRGRTRHAVHLRCPAPPECFDQMLATQARSTASAALMHLRGARLRALARTATIGMLGWPAGESLRRTWRGAGSRAKKRGRAAEGALLSGTDRRPESGRPDAEASALLDGARAGGARASAGRGRAHRRKGKHASAGRSAGGGGAQSAGLPVSRKQGGKGWRHGPDRWPARGGMRPPAAAYDPWHRSWWFAEGFERSPADAGALLDQLGGRAPASSR